MATRLTRPQRQAAYALGMIALWLACMTILCMRTGEAWTMTGPGLGVHESRFGMYHFLTVRRQPANLGGAPGPGQTVDLVWHGPGVLFTLVFTVGVTAVTLLLHRWSVARERLVGRCDECGYDLTAGAGTQCPECGAGTPTPPRAH